jgi:hypothetical protein
LLYNAIDVKPNDKNETIEGLFLSNIARNPSEQIDYQKQYPEKVKELKALRDSFVASLPTKKE